jgi:serine/threonine-protein kinase
MGDLHETKPQDPNLGRVLAEKFRIEALIGEGGMGSVYRGVQLSIGRPVAIKLIAGAVASHPECIKRFRREAEAMALLTHPNTVRLYDFGAERGELYMVMELLEGEDLADCLARKGALAPREAIDILRQVLAALSEAHALGIVHRDLKPANVFLSRVPDGQVFAKVMDFGIAGIQQDTGRTKLTLAGSVLGTPAYMAPEQAQGNPVDARSDLYSLGILLFEMLTGNTPFVADSVVHLLLAQVSQAPPRLAALRPELPLVQALQALLDQLLEKAPDERPASAAAALALLEPLARQLDQLDSLVLAPTLAAQAPVHAEPAPVPAARTPVVQAIARPWRGRDMRIAGLVSLAMAVVCVVALWPEQGPQPGAASAPAKASAPVGAALVPEPSPVAPESPAPPRPADAPRAGSARQEDERAQVPAIAVPVPNALAAGEETAGEAPEAVPGEGEPARPFPRLRKALDKIFGPGEQSERGATSPPTASYPDVRSAKRAYRAGQIGEQAYEDNIRALKLRRARRIDAEKQNLRAGSIHRAEYKRRVREIDADYEGR